MDKQIIINQAVKRYRGLDEILRRKMPEDEEAAFLQGRMLELMLLIYALDEQAIVLLTKRPVDTKPENVSVLRLMSVN